MTTFQRGSVGEDLWLENRSRSSTDSRHGQCFLSQPLPNPFLILKYCHIPTISKSAALSRKPSQLGAPYQLSSKHRPQLSSLCSPLWLWSSLFNLLFYLANLHIVILWNRNGPRERTVDLGVRPAHYFSFFCWGSGKSQHTRQYVYIAAFSLS